MRPTGNDSFQRSQIACSFSIDGGPPHCYKRLPDVLAEHDTSIRIVHTLKPLGVAMAGANEFDPYKD